MVVCVCVGGGGGGGVGGGGGGGERGRESTLKRKNLLPIWKGCIHCIRERKVTEVVLLCKNAEQKKHMGV